MGDLCTVIVVTVFCTVSDWRFGRRSVFITLGFFHVKRVLLFVFSIRMTLRMKKWDRGPGSNF